MPTKIRLQRRGRKKRPFYHIVVADSRAPRDGRFIEKLGTYNPMTSPATIDLDVDRSLDWLMKGAQPTETARAILKFKGVLYKKHLSRGVLKGAFSQEEADRLWEAFMNDKNAKIQARFEQSAEARRKTMEAISGTVVAQEEPVVEEVTEEATEATEEVEAAAEETAEATEEVTAEAEEASEEATETTEEPAEEAAEKE